MLVLTRRRNEKVHVLLPDGRKVIVCIADIQHGGKIKLGFEVPEDIKIFREELIDAPGRE